MDMPEAVWQNSSSLDILGPLTQTSEDRKYLLIFQDELSKYTEAVPIPQQDAMTWAKVFLEEIVLKFGIPWVKIVLKFGIPRVILSDQYFYFLSDLLANVCKLLRIKTSPYHPQTTDL